MERLGSLAYQKNLPSFNCATARRQVEKAICADPGLAQLDRNINDVFLRVIASAESDSHRAALALTREQRDFIGKRNASFGRRGYDLRQAMEERLEKLNDHRPAVGLYSVIGRSGQRFAGRSPACDEARARLDSIGTGLCHPWLFRLDLAPLPVTMRLENVA